MKRNDNIVPLSRDHHFGLLLCWKIRQGIKLNIDPERIKRYVLYFWNGHLKRHFDEEENILFILKEDPQCRRAMEEHRLIERHITGLADGNADINLLQAIADRIDAHIRFEERELFPYLERTLQEEELNDIGSKLRSSHAGKPADDYDDEFWVPARGGSGF